MRSVAPFRFLSLFSGIEAASVAFAPLGWQCVGVAEIESFPCKLLKHYYPDVPNLGDVTKITREQIEALGHIDLVCGGFPCQDLSVAGKRAGLRNNDGTATRSGLFFDAMRIVGWARARWLKIENVPGLYSSNRGRDFAAVVGAMAGCEFDVPEGGWRNSGAAVGPLGLVEWRCLDAQFFGLAQRRERVFLVRDSGDWAGRSPVLLEPEGLRGDPAPRREAGQRIARPVAACPEGGSGYRNDADTADNLVSIDLTNGTLNGTLTTEGEKGNRGHGVLAFGGNNTSGPIEVATALNASASASASGRMDFESESFVLQPLPFDTTQMTSAANRSAPKAGDPMHPLAAQAHVPAIAFSCKDFGADASADASPTLRAMGHDGSHANAGGQVAIAFNARQDPINGPIDTDGTTSAVAAGTQVRRITPNEAERLQGFPDGFTRIPLRRYKKRIITKLRPESSWEPDGEGGWWLMSADGPRYRGLGNSWAVPCVAWIARRINTAHAATEAR